LGCGIRELGRYGKEVARLLSKKERDARNRVQKRKTKEKEGKKDERRCWNQGILYPLSNPPKSGVDSTRLNVSAVGVG